MESSGQHYDSIEGFSASIFDRVDLFVIGIHDILNDQAINPRMLGTLVRGGGGGAQERGGMQAYVYALTLLSQTLLSQVPSSLKTHILGAQPN